MNIDKTKCPKWDKFVETKEFKQWAESKYKRWIELEAWKRKRKKANIEQAKRQKMLKNYRLPDSLKGMFTCYYKDSLNTPCIGYYKGKTILFKDAWGVSERLLLQVYFNNNGTVKYFSLIVPNEKYNDVKISIKRASTVQRKVVEILLLGPDKWIEQRD